jgi:hypothetical protein
LTATFGVATPDTRYLPLITPVRQLTSRSQIGEFVEFNGLIHISLAVIVTVLSLFQELEIKKLAKEGNHEGCKILAKQLIQLRKQKTRTYAAGSKVWVIFCHILVHIYVTWIEWSTICHTVFEVK